MHQQITSPFSQNIAEKICNNITFHIPFASARKSLQSNREQKIKDQCIQFANEAMQIIRKAERIPHEQISKIPDICQKFPLRGQGSRLSIVRKRKESKVDNQKEQSPKNQLTSAEKTRRNQLIRLEDNEVHDHEYEKFVEVLRKRKEKFNWAMEDFQKKEELKVLKNKNNHQCITDFQGKVLKLEKRERKELTNFQKLKIKPNVILKPLPTSRSQSKKKKSLKFSHEDFDFLREEKAEENGKLLSKKSLKAEKENFNSIMNIIEEKRFMETQQRKHRKLK